MLILPSSSRSGTRFHYDVLLDETKLIPDPTAMIPDPDFVPDPDNPDAQPPMIPDPDAPQIPDPAYIYSADWIMDRQGTDESDDDFTARIDVFQQAIEVDLSKSAAQVLAQKQGNSFPLGDRDLPMPPSASLPSMKPEAPMTPPTLEAAG
jgi:hypothetical protein